MRHFKGDGSLPIIRAQNLAIMNPALLSTLNGFMAARTLDLHPQNQSRYLASDADFGIGGLCQRPARFVTVRP